MKQEKRSLVNYFELLKEWQEVARLNNEDCENQIYIEPLPTQDPSLHVLIDLSECMRTQDPTFDGIISCSNTFAFGVKFLDNSDTDILLTYLN